MLGSRTVAWTLLALSFLGAAEAADDLAGWTRAGAAAPPPSCAIEQPALPLRATVNALVHRPADLARPTARCDEALVVPLAADAMLLERVEGAEPTLTWTPKLTPMPRGGGCVVVDVDVRPLRPVPQEGPQDGPRPLTPAPMVRHYEPVRVRMDPSRPGAHEADPFSTFTPIPPRIAPRRLDAISSDVLALECAGQWLAVDLDVDRGQRTWYRLSEAEIFGLPGRVLVAPTPRHPRAVLELFSVDAATLAVTDLGQPQAPGEAWRKELSDARERGGALEILVIVRDASARGALNGPVYGMLLRRAANEWVRVAMVPLPPAAAPRSLRFDAADPGKLRLEHDGALFTRHLP